MESYHSNVGIRSLKSEHFGEDGTSHLLKNPHPQDLLELRRQLEAVAADFEILFYRWGYVSGTPRCLHSVRWQRPCFKLAVAKVSKGT